MLRAIPAEAPTGAAPFTNFSYALQWITFGAVAIVALGIFIRLELLQRKGTRPSRGALRDALAGRDDEEARRLRTRRRRPGGLGPRLTDGSGVAGLLSPELGPCGRRGRRRRSQARWRRLAITGEMRTTVPPTARPNRHAHLACGRPV